MEVAIKRLKMNDSLDDVDPNEQNIIANKFLREASKFKYIKFHDNTFILNKNL